LFLISLQDSLIDNFVQISIPFFNFSHLSTTFDGEHFKNEETHFLYPDKQEYEKEMKDFTIDSPVWPEFLSCNKLYPKQTKNERIYKPTDLKRTVFFQEGKEMFRFKAILSTEDTNLECRMNPIQMLIDVPKVVRMIEYVMKSFPDSTLKPPGK
jgi:hypothetical protein